MTKGFISSISFLLLMAFFINGFSASYTAHDMSNLSYVLALGIDVGEKAKMKISMQFSKTAVFSSGEGSTAEDASNIVLVACEADSLFSGINLLNSYVGKEINLAGVNGTETRIQRTCT